MSVDAISVNLDVAGEISQIQLPSFQDSAIYSAVGGFFGFGGAYIFNKKKNKFGETVETVAVPMTKKQISVVKNHYSQLPRDKGLHEQYIDELLKELGTNSFVGLAWKTSKLYDIKARIKGVHPLKFLGYICARDSGIVHYMHPIFNDNGKIPQRTQFVSELSEGIEREKRMSNLYQHISGFAEEVGKDPGVIENYISEKNIEGLCRYVGNA